MTRRFAIASESYERAAELRDQRARALTATDCRVAILRARLVHSRNIAEILAGVEMEDVAAVEAISDRREAISRAIGIADGGDVVVIAGKGHERGQQFENGRTVPFDDVEVAAQALREYS